MAEQARKLDEERFWRLAAEARAEVERWPVWKQAAAGGVLRHQDLPESRQATTASTAAPGARVDEPPAAS